jgi:hypothetical protein
MYFQRAAMELTSVLTRSEWAERSYILTVNGGSSSLKFAFFAMGARPARLLSGRAERVGMPSPQLVVPDADAIGRMKSPG